MPGSLVELIYRNVAEQVGEYNKGPILRHPTTSDW